MKKKVPAGVLVIAIFHFIFASCGGISTLWQVSGAPRQFQQLQAQGNAQQVRLEQEIQDVLSKRVPGWRVYEGVGLALGGIFSILLLVLGIGLLNLQPWARHGSLAYAILSILFSLFGLFYYLLIAMEPINQGIQEAVPRAGINDPAVVQMMQTIMVAAGIGGSFCGMIYPIAVLIVMLLPSVSKAFSTGGLQPPTYEEDDFGGFERDRYE
jgi:hypothetical protein